MTGLGLHGHQALALGAFAGELAVAADRFRLLPGLLFGRLLVMAAELHLAEDALALHLFLQHLEGLVDIVVADENLHAFVSNRRVYVGCGHPVVPGTCRDWRGPLAERRGSVHHGWWRPDR